MKTNIQTITSLLRQADIEGYIALGSPTDEYDSEAQALALAFKELNDKEINIENITTIIIEAWKQSFNLDDSEILSRKQEIEKLAKIILALNK